MPFPVRSLTVAHLHREMEAHADAILIDVRTEDEKRRYPGTDNAWHLDFLDSGFEERLRPLDRSVPYYLFCDTGKRSRLAAEMMAARGFVLVAWLEGGVQALGRFHLESGHQGSLHF